MTILNPTSTYMNPETGSVATGEDWMADQKADGWPVSDLDALVEVFRDGDGWTDEEPSTKT